MRSFFSHHNLSTTAFLHFHSVLPLTQSPLAYKENERILKHTVHHQLVKSNFVSQSSQVPATHQPKSESETRKIMSKEMSLTFKDSYHHHHHHYPLKMSSLFPPSHLPRNTLPSVTLQPFFPLSSDSKSSYTI